MSFETADQTASFAANSRKHRMKALLVRVGADQSKWGGRWNSPIDSRTRDFVYVPIPESGSCHPGLNTPYSAWSRYLIGSWPSLPARLSALDMHLDPDFDHLTYGDQGERAKQIVANVGPGDLLVFYAGFVDVNPAPRLVYALIGLYVIDKILPIASVPRSRWHINAHTRRTSPFATNDLVVFAKRNESGRLKRAIPIGHFRKKAYRVRPHLLAAWGGLNVKNGYIQRSARLPMLSNAPQFYRWFLGQGVPLIRRNN
jgi:hypothetical protein